MITVVCGFPRSGTSLMMKMLQAGGVALHYDHEYSYECEDMLSLPEHTAWLDKCEGKAIKVLEPLYHTLPFDREYRFIWMSRTASDIALSQSRFLGVMGVRMTTQDKSNLAKSFMQDKPKILSFLRSYPNCKLIEIKFSELLFAPLVQAARIQEFLSLPDGVYELMAAVVEKRSPEPSTELRELRYVREGA